MPVRQKKESLRSPRERLDARKAEKREPRLIEKDSQCPENRNR
jgi:hypothetical protein